jgi:hypothetical protein
MPSRFAQCCAYADASRLLRVVHCRRTSGPNWPYARAVGCYPSPEEAVVAEDPVPAQYVRVVAVEYAPDGRHTVVFIEYNEPPRVEPYVVLCDRTQGRWSQQSGVSGGGVSWFGTSDDGSVGVETTWHPPTARWNVPSQSGPAYADGSW